MAKAKAAGSVQNRHIYTRASYLYQAAYYLASASLRPSSSSSSSSSSSPPDTEKDKESRALANTSRRVLADMRAITLKTQIRCTPAVKRSVCKFCDTLQLEGRTCTAAVENTSRGGRKPWADVLVVRCGTCGHVKRFPMGERQKKGRRRKDLDTVPMTKDAETKDAVEAL